MDDKDNIVELKTNSDGHTYIENRPEQLEFEAAVKPLMKYMADNCSPHCIATVHMGAASLYTSEKCFSSDEFTKDLP